MKFTALQFTPTKWDSADQKAKFANQFIKLVTNGFRRQDFPKWFYIRLSMTFGHIAHYNQEGFYSYWFESKSKQARFVQNSVKHPCHGDPAWTYSDVEKAIVSWLCDNSILSKAYNTAKAEIQTAEDALIRQILSDATPERRKQILGNFTK